MLAHITPALASPRVWAAHQEHTRQLLAPNHRQPVYHAVLVLIVLAVDPQHAPDVALARTRRALEPAQTACVSALTAMLARTRRSVPPNWRLVSAVRKVRLLTFTVQTKASCLPCRITLRGNFFHNFSSGGSMCGNVLNATALASCSTASSVIIVTVMDSGISSSCLKSVGGNLNIDGNSNGANNNLLVAIAFPLLTYTTGYFQVWNSAGYLNVLTFVNVGGLTYVGGYVFFGLIQMLTYLNLSSLTSVGQYLSINHNIALATLLLPTLTYIGQSLTVYTNALTSLYLSSLTYVGQWIQISDNINLATLSAPAISNIACQQDSCFVNGHALYFCNNAASFSYSMAIQNAAAGQVCFLPPNSCSNTICSLSCNAGSYFPQVQGLSYCLLCSAGTYSTSSGASTCSGCSAGTSSTSYGATASSVCLTCSAGTYSTTSASSCFGCSAGSYSSIAGASACISCVAGMYSSTPSATSSTVCGNCTVGTYSSAGSGSCVSCSPGAYSSTIGASACSPCASGTYSTKVGATLSAVCLNCSAGSYSQFSGSSTCMSCVAGSYSTSVGASSPAACLSCTTGSYSLVGATLASGCMSCASGALMQNKI